MFTQNLFDHLKVKLDTDNYECGDCNMNYSINHNFDTINYENDYCNIKYSINNNLDTVKNESNYYINKYSNKCEFDNKTLENITQSFGELKLNFNIIEKEENEPENDLIKEKIENITENIQTGPGNTKNSENSLGSGNIIISIKKEETKKKNMFISKKRNSSRKDDFSILNKSEEIKITREKINKFIEVKNKAPLLFMIFPDKLQKRKRERIIVNRKGNADLIRKKIKSAFHRWIKDTINIPLKLNKSKYLFKNLSQEFITKVKKEVNRDVLNMTLKELYSKNFNTNEDVKNCDFKNYRNNILALEYLDKNKELSKKSNFDVFKDMKYFELYDEFLKSKEFEIEVLKQNKENKENKNYQERYIELAINLIDFYLSPKKGE